MTPSQKAAALHGIATNPAHPIDDRLGCGLQALAWYEAETQRLRDLAEINENTSDGYHTFAELYRYRMLYNAALFNGWCYSSFQPHKSLRHSDGELCFGGGWFVVMAQLPTGQISNHYRTEDWDLFAIPERERAAVWDGHTPADVERRLTAWLESEAARAQHGTPRGAPMTAEYTRE